MAEPTYQIKTEATYEALTGVRARTGMFHITQHTSDATDPSLLSQLQRQFDRLHLALDQLVDCFIVQETSTTVGIVSGVYRLQGSEKSYAGTTGLTPSNNNTTYYWLDSSNALQSNTTGFQTGRTDIWPIGEVVVSGGAITSVTNRTRWNRNQTPLMDLSGTTLDLVGQTLADTTQDGLELGNSTTAPLIANMTDAQRDALSTPLAGMIIWNTTSTQLERYNGSSWGTFAGGVTDHGALTGLGDDDHTIYALLAGRAGGQSIIGGTAASEVLTLDGTSHATDGGILIAAGNYLDIPEISAPGNPSAGFNRFYTKSDDQLYSKDSDGNEQPVNPHSVIDDDYHTDVKDGLTIAIGQILAAEDDSGTTRFNGLSPGAQYSVLEVAQATGALGWKSSSGTGQILREDEPSILTFQTLTQQSSDPGAANIPTNGVAIYGKSGTLYAQKESDGSTQDLFARAASGAHNLLDSTDHSDTATGTPVRGDLIMANSTPAWARLAVGAANALLQSDGTDAVYSSTITSATLATQLTLDQTTADYTLTWADPAAARAISFEDPGGTDVIAYKSATQTFANKTFSSAILVNADNTIDIGNSTNHIRDLFIKGAIVEMEWPIPLRVTLDGGGSAIAAGLRGGLSIPKDITITKWRVLEESNNSGSITCDVQKCTYAQYDAGATHPSTSVAGSDKPLLSSALKNESTSLTGWTTDWDAGDIVWIEAEATPSTVQKVTVELWFKMRT